MNEPRYNPEHPPRWALWNFETEAWDELPRSFQDRWDALTDVVEAARALRYWGPSNRSGDKYAAKRAALDALDDALDVLA